MGKKAILWGVIINTALFSACIPLTRPTEEGLRKKVEYVWQQRLKGNWGATWDVLCPEFKKGISRDVFGRGSAPVREYEILSIEISPDERRAKVKLSMTVEHMGFKFKGIPTEEEWLFENGEWCLVLKPPKPPFGSTKPSPPQ
ncbi:MAG TPA: hypothetical protein ENG67_03305 [candidate division WOR-3 bacterium]|uniref:Uncharacterized protein n=1 Tax=candidate division WOR-3 bacterium TaxID=2052148 RepID=A0A7C0XD13_UNCW3|nr:hypothetical protein [candidate division WOR-3 bacterium]